MISIVKKKKRRDFGVKLPSIELFNDSSTSPNDLDYKIVKHQFSKRLSELNELKNYEIRNMPIHRPYLVIVLDMPNVLKAIKMVEQNFRSRHVKLRFEKWLTFVKKLRIARNLATYRVIICAVKIQKQWKRRFHEIREIRRTTMLNERFKKTYKNAALKIEKSYLAYRQYTLQEKKRINIDTFWKLRSSMLIQKTFRGMKYRSERKIRLKIAMLEYLRQWAEGDILKLFERAGLRDIGTQTLLTASFAVTSASNLPWRNLPSIKKINSLFQRLRLRQKQEYEEIAWMKIEYHNMIRERHDMHLEDSYEKFRKYYSIVVEEIKNQEEKRKKIKAQLLKEDERVRKLRSNMNSVVESLNIEKLSERVERENMFRAEYTQRRYDIFIRTKLQSALLTERELMVQEDKRSESIRNFEKDSCLAIIKKYSDWQIIKKVKPVKTHNRHDPGLSRDYDDEDEALIARLKSCARLNSFDIRQFCKCDNLYVSSMLKRHQCEAPVFSLMDRMSLESLQEKSIIVNVREISFEEFLEHRDSDQRAISISMLHQKYKNLPLTKEELFYTIKEDKSYLFVGAKLNSMKRLRSFRKNNTLKLQEFVNAFERKLHNLEILRIEMKTKKIPTRNERKRVLEKAITYETELVSIESELRSLSVGLYEDTTREINLFIELFNIHIVNKSGVTTDSAVDAESVLKPKELKKELPLRHSTKKKKMNYLREVKVKKEIKLIPNKMTASNNKGVLKPSPTHLDPIRREAMSFYLDDQQRDFMDEKDFNSVPVSKHKEYAACSPPFIVVKTIDSQLLSTQRNNLSESGSGLHSPAAWSSVENENTQKKVPLMKPHVKSSPHKAQHFDVKPKTILPGLSLFQDIEVDSYEFIEQAKKVCEWSRLVSQWFLDVERIWKKDKYAMCIHFVLRAIYLLRGGNMSDNIMSGDVLAANIVRRADVLDLFELLLCRRSISIKVKSLHQENVTYPLQIESHTLDNLFSMSSFSLLSYICMKKKWSLATAAHLPACLGLSCESCASWKFRSTIGGSDCLFTRLNILRPSGLVDLKEKDLMRYSHLTKDSSELVEHHELNLHRTGLGSMAQFALAIDAENKELLSFMCCLSESACVVSVKYNGSFPTLFDGDHRVFSKLFLCNIDSIVMYKTYRNELLNMTSKIGANSVSNMKKIFSKSNRWVQVPPWMFPIYYVGTQASDKENFWKRLALNNSKEITNETEHGGENKLEKFSNFISKCAFNVILVMKKKVHERKASMHLELEMSMQSHNSTLMANEDLRASLLYNIESEYRKYNELEKNFLENEKKIKNKMKSCLLRNKKISPHLELIQNIDMLKYQFRNLNSSAISLSMPRYDKDIMDYKSNTSFVDFADISFPSIDWIDRSILMSNITEHHKNVFPIPNKYKYDVKELVVCGGFKTVTFFSRNVTDPKNNSYGNLSVDTMTIPDDHHDDHISQIVRESRIGYQSRPLCENRYDAFALSVSERGGMYAENAFRLLRTEMPKSELKTAERYNQVLVNLIVQSRYHNLSDTVLNGIVKLQACQRRKMVGNYVSAMNVSRDAKK